MSDNINRTNQPAISNTIVDYSDNEIKTLTDKLTPESKTLKNGKSLYIFNNPSIELIRIDLISNGGLFKQKHPFIASLTAEMLKEGTKHYSSEQIADLTDYYGAILETRAESENSIISLSTPAKHFEKLLPLLYEITHHPQFPQNELSIKLSQLKQQFAINCDKTSFIAKRNLKNMIFGNNHPLGYMAIESDYDNTEIKNIIEFFQNNYNGYDIILSGNITDKVIQKTEETFGQTPVKNNPTILQKNINPSADRYKVSEKQASVQSTISMGKVLISPHHKDYTALGILTTVLGGYFGSRLMTNIREDKGYSYGISARIFPFREFSLLMLSTDVGTDVTSKALDEILKEIKRIKNEPIPQNELETAISYISGQILRSIDGTFSIADDFISRQMLQRNTEEFIAKIKVLKNTTPENLIEIANRYYNADSIYTSIAGSILKK